MSHGRTVGIGSMAVDRIRRVPRILAGEEKGMIHVRGAMIGLGVAMLVLTLVSRVEEEHLLARKSDS